MNSGRNRRGRRSRAAALLVATGFAILAVAWSTGLRSAAADTTGFRDATAQAAASGGDGDGYENNASLAFTDANGEAEDRDSGTNTNLSCTDAGKDRHLYYNYGLSVPSGATINGITARVDARLDNASGYICIQLSWDGGVSWTSPKQTAGLTATFTTSDAGGPADTWGRSWAASDFSNANFRVRVIDVANNGAARFRLDWVGLQVTYTPAPADTVGPVTSNVAAVDAGGGLVALTARVDDAATGSSNVTAAEYFVDAVGANGAGTAMAAADGAYSSPAEDVTATVAMSGLPAGDHTLHVHGRDAAGNWGATASVVVTVTTGGGSAVVASLTIVAGGLALDAYPVAFPGVILNGLPQTVETRPTAWRVVDGRGTGDGWNITVTSSDFTSAAGGIPVANFKLQLPQTSVVVVSGNTPPVSLVTSFQSLSNSIPLKLIAADTGTGMGTYEFAPDFSLTVPASARQGAYEASVVVSVNSGP